jgi:outer membrane protein assembly factor BamB
MKGSIGRWQTFTSPAVADGVVLFGTVGGYLSGFNAETGEEIWLEDYGTENGFRCPASIAADKAYIGSLSGNFYCLNLKTGKTVWEDKTSAEIVGAPYVGDGFVVVGNDAGEIICYE